MLRVLLVEDHSLVRAGLRLLLSEALLKIAHRLHINTKTVEVHRTPPMENASPSTTPRPRAPGHVRGHYHP
jgi:DNA-binding NarL/FixJ family response regulator